MWTLIGLGTSVAFVYSVVATLAPQLFPSTFVVAGQRGGVLRSGRSHRFADAARAGPRAAARSQTSAAIKSLLGLAPKTARRIQADGSEEDVPLDASACGRPAACAPGREGAGRRRGARRPQRAWTNRCSPASRLPVSKRQGDKVIGATLNGTGAPGHSRRTCGLGHRAVADRADGGAGAALARADATHGRRRCRLLRGHGRGASPC